MANETLKEFAETFDYCAICWSMHGLHIHHIVGGAGRLHEKFNLLRLCHMAICLFSELAQNQSRG